MNRPIVLLLLALGVVVKLSAQDAVERFGLTHVPLGAAHVFFNDTYGRLTVEGLQPAPTNGVRTILGQADSGAFFYPDANYVDQGYFMHGDVYGSINGATNRFVGNVRGLRRDYGDYRVTANFSGIGAESLTFEAWRGNVKVAESTVTSGEAMIQTSFLAPPRVNPWWRQPNGERGALVQFASSYFWISVPGCNESIDCLVNADRLFIRPNGATGVVDFVSHVDVFGGGGLPEFYFNDVRVGMFGHAHAAFDQTKVSATNGTLTLSVTNVGVTNSVGVLTEFPESTSAEVQLAPLPITAVNTNWEFETLSISVSGHDANFPTTLGSLLLINSNDVVFIADYFGQQNIVSVLSNGVPVGSDVFVNGPLLAIDGSVRLTAVRCAADRVEGPAELSLRFESNVLVHLSSNVFGNEIVFAHAQKIGVRDITGMALSSRLLSAFTITAESSTLFEPRLNIVRDGDLYFLKWSDPSRTLRVLARNDLSDPWYEIEIPIIYDGDTATAPVDPEFMFYRLVGFSYND